MSAGERRSAERLRSRGAQIAAITALTDQVSVLERAIYRMERRREHVCYLPWFRDYAYATCPACEETRQGQRP